MRPKSQDRADVTGLAGYLHQWMILPGAALETLLLGGTALEPLLLGPARVWKIQRLRTLPLRSVAQRLLERFRLRLLPQLERRAQDFCRLKQAPGDEDLIDS